MGVLLYDGHRIPCGSPAESDMPDIPDIPDIPDRGDIK